MEAKDLRGKLELLILHLLSESPKHGYLLMKELRELTGCAPSPGAIYPLLRGLLEKGLLEVRIRKKGGRIIKMYSITEEGRRQLEERRHELDQVLKLIASIRMFEQLGGAELRATLRRLILALPDMSPEARERVREVIGSCVGRLRELLEEVGGGEGAR